ncbi:mitochondrial import inner membrane translocase subunit Tim21-like isoform X2 [Xenia sp. Carnegie-2017]|uniref:mitochondrial import inner membrane translocase subunit Tim21-like isoform X2 n=1 Tax=Xenia sp. Carnegie-2017 TaxID=2897299 RepID=UPI001F04213E|nr:mitochondrial import inner membrane translocase subunit Tim21-like isoform X2 [Xenia sp. Carnegie-2017]
MADRIKNMYFLIQKTSHITKVLHPLCALPRHKLIPVNCSLWSLANQACGTNACKVFNEIERTKGFPLLQKRSLSLRQFHGRASNVKYQKAKKPETLQELVEATDGTQTAVTVGQKVVQAGKDVSYFAILLAGFAVTGALLWYVISELFLSSSPNKIYADALKKVKMNEEIIDALGEPIKGYGEETGRGRRRHISYQEYIVGEDSYMRVRFYVSGCYRKGTVHVDMKCLQGVMNIATYLSN